MLWLTLRFPQLPLNALGYQQQSAQAVAIIDNGRVIQCTDTAKAMGVSIGDKVEDQQGSTFKPTRTALTPISPIHANSQCQAKYLPRNKAAEQQHLQHLMAWGYRFTAHIKQHDNNSLLFDISRCLRLFGDIEQFCARLFAQITDLAYSFQFGIAHTSTASWLLSFQQFPACQSDSQHCYITRLKRLPLAYLPKVFSQLIRRMKIDGISTIGELLSINYDELEQRYGQSLLMYLQSLITEETTLTARSTANTNTRHLQISTTPYTDTSINSNQSIANTGVPASNLHLSNTPEASTQQLNQTNQAQLKRLNNITHNIWPNTAANDHIIVNIDHQYWPFQRPQPIKTMNQQLFWQGKLQLIKPSTALDPQKNLHQTSPRGSQKDSQQDSQHKRQYFIAERSDNVRYCIYHDTLQNQWYAQGLFAALSS